MPHYILYGLNVVMVIAVILQIKNHLVMRARHKAIKIIYSSNHWEGLAAKYLEGNNRYYAQLLHPGKWTYKQMYGELKADNRKNR